MKAPIALLLPFFVWRRRWRLAAYSAAALALWIAAPALWMGAARWGRHHAEWLDAVRGGARPAEQRVQNQSLRSAVLHSLVTYPPGDPRRPDHAAYAPIGDLSEATAGRAAIVIALALVCAIAWATRRRPRTDSDVNWLRDCAAVMVLLTLLSPIVWSQHFVLLLPALYLIAADLVEGGRRGMRTWIGVAVYGVLALVLTREALGRDLHLVALAYHTQTAAALVVLVMISTRSGRLRSAVGQDVSPAMGGTSVLP
jgi:hypothetical protein